MYIQQSKCIYSRVNVYIVELVCSFEATRSSIIPLYLFLFCFNLICSSRIPQFSRWSLISVSVIGRMSTYIIYINTHTHAHTHTHTHTHTQISTYIIYINIYIYIYICIMQICKYVYTWTNVNPRGEGLHLFVVLLDQFQYVRLLVPDCVQGLPCFVRVSSSHLFFFYIIYIPITQCIILLTERCYNHNDHTSVSRLLIYM